MRLAALLVVLTAATLASADDACAKCAAKPKPTAAPKAAWWSGAAKWAESGVARLKKANPDAVKRSVNVISRRVAILERDWKNLGLEEKAAVAQELWRMRGAINLLAGLPPSMVASCTGLPERDVARLQTAINGLIRALPKSMRP